MIVIQASDCVTAAALAFQLRLAWLAAKRIVNAMAKALFLKRIEVQPLVFSRFGEFLNQPVYDPELSEVGVPRRLCLFCDVRSWSSPAVILHSLCHFLCDGR